MDLYSASSLAEEEDEAPATMTFEEYEAHKIACQEVLETAEAAERLTNNPDFQRIIIGVYMTDEPRRLASLIASGRLTPKATEDTFEDLKAIGNLNTFMSGQLQKGNIARNELAQLQEAWDQFVTEDSDQS